MKINVRIFRGPLREIVGADEITVQMDNTARTIDVLRFLAAKYGKQFKEYVFNSSTGEVKSYILLSLNGKNVSHMNGLETPVVDGSELLILSAAGGG